MDSLEQRRRELLDGKRSWNYHVDAGGDFDVFSTAYVSPLRKLRELGVIEKLVEERISAGGISRVGIIQIVGAIKKEA